MHWRVCSLSQTGSITGRAAVNFSNWARLESHLRSYFESCGCHNDTQRSGSPSGYWVWSYHAQYYAHPISQNFIFSVAKATPDTVGISPVCSDGGQTWSFVYTRQTLYEGTTFLTWIVFLDENSNTIGTDLSQDTQGLTSRFATNDSWYIDMNHPIHFRSYDLAFIPILYEYVRNTVCVCVGAGGNVCTCVYCCTYPCMCVGKVRSQGQLSPSIALHLTVLSQGLTLVLELTT